MEELTGALIDRRMDVAERQNLPYVYRELDFQISGDVSDETTASIGKFLSVEMVITGQLIDLDGRYCYRARSAGSDEKALRASVIRLDIQGGREMRRIIEALADQKNAKYGVNENTVPGTSGAFLDRGILFETRGDYDLAIPALPLHKHTYRRLVSLPDY